MKTILLKYLYSVFSDYLKNPNYKNNDWLLESTECFSLSGICSKSFYLYYLHLSLTIIPCDRQDYYPNFTKVEAEAQWLRSPVSGKHIILIQAVKLRSELLTSVLYCLSDVNYFPRYYSTINHSFLEQMFYLRVRKQTWLRWL